MKVGKYRMIIIILTIITTSITVVRVTLSLVMRAFIQNKFQINTDKSASSIGIIGGADGPTSILLSTSSYSNVFTIICAFLSVVGITYLLYTKRKQK